MNAKHLTYTCLFLLLFIGCVSPPENFPSIPEISFENVAYVERTNASDSLIIAIKFKDAEGDLGLDAKDINPPFNDLEYLTDDQGDLITYSNRPPEAPSYNPIDWAVNPTINNTPVNDTIWVKQNPNFNNIFVQFFIKRSGTFNEFKWSDPPFYTSFNGRFPTILSGSAERAIEGTIEYAMMSSGWRSIFRNDTVRLDVHIQDRALNKSNVISTPEFTLNQITR